MWSAACWVHRLSSMVVGFSHVQETRYSPRYLKSNDRGDSSPVHLTWMRGEGLKLSTRLNRSDDSIVLRLTPLLPSSLSPPTRQEERWCPTKIQVKSVLNNISLFILRPLTPLGSTVKQSENEMYTTWNNLLLYLLLHLHLYLFPFQSHLIDPEHQCLPTICIALTFLQYHFLAWQCQLVLVRLL